MRFIPRSRNFFLDAFGGFIYNGFYFRTILGVCSCSVLPVCPSIRKKGWAWARLFRLCARSEINVLAITLTFTDLKAKIGIIKSMVAVLLTLLFILIMTVLYFKGECTHSDAKNFVESNISHFNIEL